MSKGSSTKRRPAASLTLLLAFLGWLVASCSVVPAVGASRDVRVAAKTASGEQAIALSAASAPAAAGVAPAASRAAAIAPPGDEGSRATSGGSSVVEPGLSTAFSPAVEPAASGDASRVAPVPPASAPREVLVSDPAYPARLGEGASEPVVATHPTDPGRLAVTYLRFGTLGGCPADPAVAVSRDGGRTWTEVRRPWLGSGRCAGFHAAIAWGPGPRAGVARLYWVGMVGGGGLRPAVAWSDDEGRSWSPMRIVGDTPGWAGGIPDITVDRSPGSPAHGTVYVVYNWRGSPTRGPGIRLLASCDFGVTWRSADIDRAPAAARYPVSWRIGARVRTGPDGSAYVAAFQADLTRWDPDRPFTKAGWGSVGRVGYSITRVRLVRPSGRLLPDPTVMATTLPVNAWNAWSAATPGTADNLADPTWSLSLDVDPGTGRVLLAGASYVPTGHRPAASPSTPGATSAPGMTATARPNGTVRVGRSDDGGRTWRWTVVPALPPFGGRPQSSFRPQIVATDGLVAVCLRGIADVPVGTSAARRLPTLGLAVTWSTDGGATFATPRPLTHARWAAASLAGATNGPGLRDRAERTADGSVVYVYGDGRLARPAPDARAGRVAIFASLVPPPGG